MTVSEDLNLSMFRAYDIRTPARLLVEDLAVRLARAEAVYFRDTLKVPGVLVARDARRTGPHYLEIFADEFCHAGLNVTVIPGVSTTSQFYFAAMKNPGLAGLFIGASHNPADDTGQKILGPGVTPIARGIGPCGGLDCIRELYLEGIEAERNGGKGRLRAFDPMPEYLRFSMERAGVSPGDLNGLKIFQDYLNGAAGREMMLAFEVAGADLTPVHFCADGQFPLGDPNPVKQDVIQEGLNRLRKGTFSFGNFFDGDGDRIDFYRGDGHYLSSSFVYAALLPSLYRRAGSLPKAVVYADLKSNPLAVREMARCGVETRVIRNGHSQIKQAMIEDSHVLGCVEESAHYYESFESEGDRYCTENTLYVALLAARVWLEDPGRFDHLFEVQSTTCREREWGYKFPSEEFRAQALEAVESYFLEEGARRMTRTPEGRDLEATLLRRGIPFEIRSDTPFETNWLQVCQRVSQSEDGLARWEVVAANRETASEAKAQIASIVRKFEAGEEYQG